jgi:glycosyltransferase involved in cell wall biosynthesis
MKVLMLGWELPPYNSGGLGVACLHMSKALAKRGVDIEFLVPYSSEHSDIDFMKVTAASFASAQEVLVTGHAYESFKYIRPDGSPQLIDIFSHAENYVNAIDNLTELGSYDIIHAHDWLTFRAGLRAKELTGKPLIAHVHATEFDRAGGGFGNPLVHEVEQLGLLLADKIIAVSELTKKIIVNEYGIPSDKVQVVHNMIDADAYREIDSNNAYHYLVKMKYQGYRVVANIGRLTIQKGLNNFLLAAKHVVDRAPKTLFLIVGSGEQYYELIEQAASLGISKNVIFTDFQRGKNLRDAFSVADLFVMPSVSEPFGLTPLEAIGYGTPALVSKQSGVSEVLNNCLKVDFWDVDEMANMITAVVQNDSLRDELHAKSYKEFETLTWDTTAEQLENSYRHHLSQGAAA